MAAEEGVNRELEVPPTIQALLAARLDRLPARERAVLERASVEGKVFHRSARSRTYAPTTCGPGSAPI